MYDPLRINDIRNPADRNFYMKAIQLKQEFMASKGTAPKFIYFGKQEWEDFADFAERNWMVRALPHAGNWFAGMAIIQLERPYHMEVSDSAMLHTSEWTVVKYKAKAGS